MKYWLLGENKNYLIVINEKLICFGSLKKLIKSEIISELNKGNIPNQLFSIPFSYIKKIVNPENKKEITIFYGNSNSEESINFNDHRAKEEVFKVLKERLFSFEYLKKKPSIINHLKPQLFALLFSSGIFTWIYYLANQLEKGYEYEIVGRKEGLTGVILGLAHFGTLKVTLGYLMILAVVLYSLMKKMKSRTITQYLKR
ncbi:hypothetical protein ACSIGC_11940 [Tenacibaculum sp. ZS6-P6]|uniref:hypothetical protein n=1 Tax=Tenacibaculum sp. ZS6-P6 TaxID=3447503 RepID=UPI003F969B96